MTDKSYRCTITISCDATAIDKTTRANMGIVDDIVEKLLAEYPADGAVTAAVTEAADIFTVRQKSETPRKPRGSAVADELATLKAQMAALTEKSAADALAKAETPLGDHLPELGATFSDAVEAAQGKKHKSNAAVAHAAGDDA